MEGPTKTKASRQMFSAAGYRDNNEIIETELEFGRNIPKLLRLVEWTISKRTRFENDVAVTKATASYPSRLDYRRRRCSEGIEDENTQKGQAAALTHKYYKQRGGRPRRSEETQRTERRLDDTWKCDGGLFSLRWLRGKWNNSVLEPRTEKRRRAATLNRWEKK
ncbi:hypothetical protein F2P81_012146 [Scophthalmus maximus]|uniref:Uncharacterized protein n=1 Tax=Scophthalmus maximus TaxID=52904 RepID=A0A6A4SQJ9_SCOMX|nr:hypothetical protein F2P81_012146 [Scophthalmus maximus]